MLEAYDVFDVAFQALIDGNEEVVGRLFLAGYAAEPFPQQGAFLVDDEIGREILAQFVIVGEGEFGGVVLEEVIERVERDHVGDDLDVDAEAPCLVGEHQAGEVVVVRILHPVEEMTFGLDLERIGLDAGARVRRRSQAQRMRA